MLSGVSRAVCPRFTFSSRCADASIGGLERSPCTVNETTPSPDAERTGVGANVEPIGNRANAPAALPHSSIRTLGLVEATDHYAIALCEKTYKIESRMVCTRQLEREVRRETRRSGLPIADKADWNIGPSLVLRHNLICLPKSG